ncbi:MAG: hypothetical protein HYR85_02085 [Planctomycetes bacterium]|nr:hypothetical protein [Planctomycetota bacterium]MBI3847047.1 hypothetical protein [Planctomycetota bacterium]
MADKRALETLFSTYWTTAGWRPGGERRTAPDEFAYAKRMGVMFDPIEVDHAAAVQRLMDARIAIDRRRVVDAFLASLSTRQLDIRSGLGSFAVFRHMTSHPFDGDEPRCGTCGRYGPASQVEDLNVLNFERFKWGGVRHDHPLYAALDLELLVREPRPSPTAGDVEIFRTIIRGIEDAPSETTAAELHSRFARALKSNKPERGVIVGIFGYCGILATPGHSGYREEFVRSRDRDLPGRRFVDMPYPACWWRRSDGIDDAALREYFGHVL